MKPQSTQKLFAFIIAMMMFVALPALVNAQKKCPDGNCPKGQVCVNGRCIKIGSVPYCNCFVRPMPPECGQICGWKLGKPPANETLSIAGTKINFELTKAQKVSVRIYDMTGRVIKTLADKVFDEGYHQLEWDVAGLQTGIYVVKMETAGFSEIRKLAVIN